MGENFYEEIIRKYISAYNSCNIAGMLKHMDKKVKFRNISNNEVTFESKGINELKEQMKLSQKYFIEREQKIKKIVVTGSKVEVDVDYNCILASDLPNGLKAGDKIELFGKSIFKFRNNKIIEYEDIS